jgi:hypothetical protein
MPTRKLALAVGPRDNGERKSTTDNQPAEVAMGRMNSYTARPDCTAARHTDARSLAVPVPHGTMIPTTTTIAPRAIAGVSTVDPVAIARHRLRSSMEKVYAFPNRLRIFFQE